MLTASLPCLVHLFPMHLPPVRPTPFFHCMRLGCALFIATLGMSVSAQLPEQATKLPDFAVSGGVPLVKEAEFHLQTARFAPAAIVDGAKIYVFSGEDRHRQMLDTIECFDTRTGQSTIVGHLHAGRIWHRAVLVGREVYILGGYGRSGGESDDDAARHGIDWVRTVEIFNLDTGQVRAGPTMPEPCTEPATILVEGQILVMGGKRLRGEQVGRTNSILTLDPRTGYWSEIRPMGVARQSDAVRVSDFVLVAGGYNGEQALDAVECYNLRTRTWSRLPPLCQPVSAHATVCLGHNLFLFGNYSAPDEILVYNLLTKKSEVFTLRFTPARHAAAVACEGKIYVIGGRPDKRAAPIDSIQVFASTAHPTDAH